MEHSPLFTTRLMLVFQCMCKNSILLVIFLLLSCFEKSFTQQVNCEVQHIGKPLRIRLVFHFVSNENRSINYTRRKSSNGIEGRKWAKKVVRKANEQLGNLHRNWRSNDSLELVKDAGFRYRLKGVKYIRNNEMACIDSYDERSDNFINRSYGKRHNRVINVFFFEEYFRGLENGGGITSRSYDPNEVFIKMYNFAWTKNQQFGNPEWVIREEAAVLNHEMGHLLGLDHDWQRDDGISDTNPYDSRTCDADQGNWENCSNNYMTIPPKFSSLEGAFTPCQIAKMHENLKGRRKIYVR